MISYPAYIVSILVGASAGSLYGYFFVMQQKNIFSSLPNRSQAVGYFLLRVALRVAVALYLLRSPQIPFILGMISFAGTFWAILLLTKAKLYEGH